MMGRDGSWCFVALPYSLYFINLALYVEEGSAPHKDLSWFSAPPALIPFRSNHAE